MQREQIDGHAPAVAGVLLRRVERERRHRGARRAPRSSPSASRRWWRRDQPPLHRVVLLGLGDPRPSCRAGVTVSPAANQGASLWRRVLVSKPRSAAERFAFAAAAVAEGDGDAVLGVPGRDHHRRDRGRPAQRRDSRGRPGAARASRAVSGAISAAFSQVTLVTGSGSSCSQETLANRPSQTR